MASLHWAAKRGLNDQVRQEIANGADIDELNHELLTPLHLATSAKHLRTVELLLNAGADPNLAGSKGETPLHKAALRGNLDIVERLVRHGADVNARTVGGATPAHRAASRRSQPVLDFLTLRGADLSLRTAKGKSVADLFKENQELWDSINSHPRSERPFQGERDVAAMRMLMAKASSADEYAARHGRRILLFSYGVNDLPDPGADRWAKRLQEILGSRELLAECEDRFLEGEELAEAKIIRERQAKASERRKLRDKRRAREQERP